MLQKVQELFLTCWQFDSCWWLSFLLVPMYLLWPAFWHWGFVVPGADISDVWNGLWSFFWAQETWHSGFCGTQLNFPKGGCIIPIDPIGTIGMSLLTVFFQPASALTILMMMHIFCIGLGTALLYQNLHIEKSEFVSKRYAILTGILMQFASIVLVGLHNGSTEVMTLGWGILGIVGWQKLQQGHFQWWPFVLLVGFTSIYVVFGFVLWVACMGGLHRFDWKNRLMLVMVLFFWAVVAFWLLENAQNSQSLLQIKSSIEMSLVRRTIGAADIRSYFVPFWDMSPNFPEISRYGEKFVHSTYVGIMGLMLLLGNLKIWWSRYWRLAFFAFLGWLFSLGPVLVMDGHPFLIQGALAIPLPYFLLEPLPIFSSMTLLYRLSWMPILGVILLSVWIVEHHLSKKYFWCMMLLMDSLFCNPNRNLPEFSRLFEPGLQENLLWLAEQESGAVVHYPLVGGRPYLFWQSIHRHPVAGMLNSPINSSYAKLLDFLEYRANYSSKTWVNELSEIAKRQGIRYWIVDLDPKIMPDHYFSHIQFVVANFPSYSDEKTHIQIVQLW